MLSFAEWVIIYANRYESALPTESGEANAR